MSGNRLADWIARCEIVAMFALAIWTWPSAPARIPIHWNIAGQIDGYGSKFIGLLLLPIVATAGYVLIGLTAVIRPEKFDGAAMKAVSWFRLAYVLLMAAVHVMIVTDILYGANLNMNYIIFLQVALVTITGAKLVVQLRRLKSTKPAPPGAGIRI